MDVGPAMGRDNASRRIAPDHALGVAEGNGERRVRWRIEGGVGLRETTQRAGPRMGDRRATLVARRALLTDTMADGAGTKRIGNGLTGRPAGGNRGQHLHHKREQDNR